MTKKGWTRILIVIVASLWGYNIYRTIENMQVKAEVAEMTQNQSLSFTPVSFNKDTFELQLPKQDPFLKGVANSTNTNNVQTTSLQTERNLPQQNRTALVPKSTDKWPTIAYHGFLRKHGEDQKLCMITIDTKSYRIQEGNTQDNVLLDKAYSDSVVLIFNEERKTFYK